MIIEVAEVKLKPGTTEEFDAAVVKIRWETLEDHTVGFREGPLFQEWRGLVGPYFAEPPVALHYEVAMERVAFSDALK